MRLFNVLTKKTIPNGKGEEPLILWHKVGLLKQTHSGHWYLQMYHVPDVDYFVYEQPEKEKELPEIQIAEEEREA